ncbi:hypothetical protein WKI65_39350 [Streptomyces sp. MS1.AVA.3]|uniref:hypothetical protein n=1 Tax=Streptomyces decoyicus TaxID=249567 RepID=UPI0030C11494
MNRLGPPSRTTAVRPPPEDGVSAHPRGFVIRGQLRCPLALTVAELRERWPFGTCAPPEASPGLSGGPVVAAP